MHKKKKKHMSVFDTTHSLKHPLWAFETIPLDEEGLYPVKDKWKKAEVGEERFQNF